MAIQEDIKNLAGDRDSSEVEPKSQIITVEKSKQKLSIDHFMALVEHKPHASMLEVFNKQEGFFYRLVKNNPHRTRYYQELGYSVVTEEDDAHLGDSGQPDGRQVAGANELVLMKQPEELHQLHKKALKNKASMLRRSPIEQFKTKAAQMGVKVIDETRESVGPIEQALMDDD